MTHPAKSRPGLMRDFERDWQSWNKWESGVLTLILFAGIVAELAAMVVSFG